MNSHGQKTVVRPGLFGTAVAADGLRAYFDAQNEQFIRSGARPAAVFIGDSITQLLEPNAFFPEAHGILINRGIGGDDTAYLRKRFEADALQLSPELIVMLIGTNEMGLRLELLNDAITGTICDNVAAMAAQAKQHQARLAICSILPVWGPAFYPVPEFTRRRNAQIVACNSRLLTIAQDHGALYVDYHAAMLDENHQLQKNLSDDGIHPNYDGFVVMMGVLQQTLRRAGIVVLNGVSEK
jgi:lysophospholipase L1-like esterase